MISLPRVTREEVRAAMNRTSVLITAIVCALIAFLGLVGGVVYLVSRGTDATAIGILVVTPVIGLLALLFRRIGAVEATVKDVHAVVSPTVTPPTDGV